MCSSIASKPMRTARFAACTKAVSMRARSASVNSAGAGQPSSNGIGEGATVVHGSSPSFKARPPSQGRSAEALRPACPIWTPNFTPGSATPRAAATVRAMARSLSSE